MMTWNQLMVQPLIRPGNLRARDLTNYNPPFIYDNHLNFSPTGEKQRTMWRFVLIRSRNLWSGKFQMIAHSR